MKLGGNTAIESVLSHEGRAFFKPKNTFRKTVFRQAYKKKGEIYRGKRKILYHHTHLLPQ